MPFSPSDLASDLIWLDAQDTVYQERTGASATTEATSNGDVVGTWLDKGSGANYFVAQADGERPTLQNSVIGGLRVLRFTGTQALTLESTAFLNNKAGVTMFCVGKINTKSTASNSTRVIRINDNGTLPRFAFGDHGSGYLLQYKRLDADSTTSQIVTYTTDLTAHVWHAYVDYANAGLAGLALTEDATAVNSYTVAGSGNTSATNSTRIAVGAIRDTTATAGFKGDIAEIILYPSYVATDDAMQVVEYLADKYSLALDAVAFQI